MNVAHWHKQIGAWMGRFHRGESGATLTEFVMTLPIFILIFMGMMQLGQFESMAGKAWGNAYKDTWARALPITQAQDMAVDFSDLTQIHANAQSASVAALHQMSSHRPHNDHDLIKLEVTLAEATTYGGLGVNGHWGESFQRTRPANNYMRFRHVDGLVANNPNQILGNSAYARALLDDAGGALPIQPGGGSGPMASLNSIINGQGLRPVIGAGIRYGTVNGTKEVDHTVMGRTVSMRAHFNTLVGPQPTSDHVTMAVTRTAMERYNPYSEMLGISMSQPLRGETISVPTLP
ncbi:MAG: pilus assembly protein [Bradymonadaceae bacterium]|nr:pilus assembly protein [Lujinxingiaceae bacterium]